MAKKSIFDRAQALRSGTRTAPSTPPAKADKAADSAPKKAAVRRTVRRRGAAPAPNGEAAAAATPEAAPA
ncbi:MAG: 4Fe-4S ferredoxin, partial [Deltaproteobacteria bacterium]|nr:4Fe-4S ferredoxin [Deltaproteobacteria bacterium]